MADIKLRISHAYPNYSDNKVKQCHHSSSLFNELRNHYMDCGFVLILYQSLTKNLE